MKIPKSCMNFYNISEFSFWLFIYKNLLSLFGYKISANTFLVLYHFANKKTLSKIISYKINSICLLSGDIRYSVSRNLD